MLRPAMPRFETDERFWEIEIEGKRVRIRSGLLGEAGQRVVHTAHFEAEARRQFDERIADKLEQGYRPIHAAREPVIELDPALREAVLEALAPEHAATPEGAAALQVAWTVLGDWLTARGDVRGELIAIDQTLSYVDGRGRDRLLARRNDLLGEWIPQWFGEYGRLDGVDRPICLAWDHGFIAAARIGTTPDPPDLYRYRLGLRDLVPVLEQVLAHPLIWTLRQLRIAELDPHGRRDLARALTLLASAQRPALIRLELGALMHDDWRRDGSGALRKHVVLTRIGSLALLARAREWAPRLAALRIVGRELRVFPALPQLRVLELDVATLSEELRTWLQTSSWPQLERMWLRTLDLDDPWAHVREGASLVDVLEHLASSPIVELGLQGPTALAIFLEFAQTQPTRLTELRLFRLGDAAVDLLIAGYDLLADVERIVLEDARIERRWDELRARYGTRVRRVAGVFEAVDGDHSDLRGSLFDAAAWRC
jgi:predicted DNA-binding WGR domain protein